MDLWASGWTRSTCDIQCLRTCCLNLTHMRTDSLMPHLLAELMNFSVRLHLLPKLFDCSVIFSFVWESNVGFSIIQFTKIHMWFLIWNYTKSISDVAGNTPPPEFVVKGIKFHPKNFWELAILCFLCTVKSPYVTRPRSLADRATYGIVPLMESWSKLL